jgi:hypothetical protein
MADTTMHPEHTARSEIAFHASGEIAALLRMLERESNADEARQDYSVILDSTLRRLRDLNRVVLAFIQEDEEPTTEQMCITVYGRAA